MHFKRALINLTAGVSLLALPLFMQQTVFATPEPQVQQQIQQQTTNKPQTTSQSRPHYLNILPLREELEKMTTLEKLVLSSRLQFKRDIKEEDIKFPFLIAPDTARADIFPFNKQVHLVLPFYKELDNGKLEFLPTSEIVEKQPILDDLTLSLERAAEYAYSLFNGMPGNANNCKEDYIANGMTMYFGHSHPMVGGQALLEIHKIGYYTKGRLDDEIWGGTILAHELIHANERLQMLPWIVYNPLETYAHMASIEKWGPFGFLSHPYSDTFRDIAEIYFNVHSEWMKQSVSKDIFFYTELNAEKFEQLSGVVSIVTKEFKQFTINKVYPEFLSNKVYWAVLSKWLNDEDFIVELMMARSYKPKVFGELEEKIFWAKNGSLVEETINECWSKLGTFEREKKSKLAGLEVRSSFSIKDNFKNLYREKYAKTNNLALDKLSEAERDRLRLETELAYNKFLIDKFLDNGKIKYNIMSLSDAQKTLGQIYNEMEGWIYWCETNNELDQNESAIYKKKLEECKWYVDRIKLAEIYSKFGNKSNFTPEILDSTINLGGYFKISPDFIPHRIKDLSAMNLDEHGMRFRAEFIPNESGLMTYSYDLFSGKGKPNGVDYVEGFKHDKNGAWESRPCLIVFCSEDKLDTMLVDYNRDGYFDRFVEVRVGDWKSKIDYKSLLGQKIEKKEINLVPRIERISPPN